MFCQTAQTVGMIEMRSYTLQPKGMAEFIKLCEENSTLRRTLLPLIGIFKVETGVVASGNASLNTIIHFYGYKDHEERDRTRSKSLQSSDWQKYISESREFVSCQESTIYIPALSSLSGPVSRLMADSLDTTTDSSLYELRQTQLIPGYGSVPNLVKEFEKGLPMKMAADNEGKLVFMAYSDVGMLNNFIELWRYPSTQACINARQKSREVQAWRNTIAAIAPGVQSFTTAFLRPLSLSPLK